ncbi:MAG: ABC transporter ATP-binding protein [Armatimonadetes bacterium]|nr:ABC transporter ATP-binding protein [Armatimonadota bacterium]
MSDYSGDYVLELRDLHVYFHTLGGRVHAVRGVDLEVRPGETLGLVGETGCGKSATASALMGLIAEPPGEVLASRLHFRGKDLLAGAASGRDRLRRLSATAVAEVRGGGISMIFQDPSAALNPVFSVVDPIRAVLRHHLMLDAPRAQTRALEWLAHVGLPDPEAVAGKYPHQLSGGMKQRVAIAMALAPEPALVLADEPTTALDVTVQAQVLALLRGLQEETRIGLLFITHDLGIVAEMCHRVAVMYAGRVVEEAPVKELFEAPRHPYTRGLFAARPTLHGGRERLAAIPGAVPPPSAIPSGCPFHPRCPRAQAKCAAQMPVLEGDPHRAACFFPVTS